MQQQLVFNYWSLLFKLCVLLVLLFIVIGYLLTPWLFYQYPQQQAGKIAAILFDIIGYSALLLLTLSVWIAQRLQQLQLKLLAGVLISLPIIGLLLLYLAPEMALIKQQKTLENLRESAAWPRFAMLHGIYQMGYLIVIAMLILQAWQSRKILVRILG